jgi:hypothetical protein
MPPKNDVILKRKKTSPSLSGARAVSSHTTLCLHAPTVHLPLPFFSFFVQVILSFPLVLAEKERAPEEARRERRAHRRSRRQKSEKPKNPKTSPPILWRNQKPQNISTPTTIVRSTGARQPIGKEKKKNVVGSTGAGQPIGKEERKKCWWRNKFVLLGMLREK